MEAQQKLSNLLTTAEVEAFARKNDNIIIRRKDNYGRLYPDVRGKTAGYMSENRYGVSWNTNFGSGRETRKIATIEQLEIELKNFGKPRPIPVTTVDLTPTIDDKLLVPEKFRYFGRKLDTGETDVEAFEWCMEESEAKNAMLIGPTGSGKTALVRYYCAKHNRPYRRVSLNGGVTVDDLVGHWVLKPSENGVSITVWVDGILTQAFTKGWVLAVDEINAAPAEILFILNPVLDDEKILVLAAKNGEVLHAHPNFRLVATCNPTEQGYAGTHEMNEALKDRFKNTTLKIDYNEAIEKRILRQMEFDEEKVKDIMKFVKRIREAYTEDAIITPFSTRAVMGLGELIKCNRTGLIVNRFRESERSTVSDILEMFIHKEKKVDESTPETSENTMI